MKIVLAILNFLICLRWRMTPSESWRADCVECKRKTFPDGRMVQTQSCLFHRSDYRKESEG